MKLLRMPFTVAGIRVKRVWREKWGLISWLALPTIIVFLMSLIAGTGGGKMTGRLLITDADNSVVSQLLSGSFNQGPLADVFTVKQVSTAQGQALMDEGEASAWVTIEAGFGEAFLDNKAARLKLIKNPSQSILPQLVETSLNLLVDAIAYAQILFDKELAVLKTMLESQQIDEADLVTLSLGIKQRIDSLEDTLFPPQITLLEQVVDAKESNADKQNITFGLLMFPGAIFMALIFSANSLAVSIWDDGKNGVIPRLSSTPAGLGAYFNGQVIGAVWVFAIIALILGIVGGWYFSLPWIKIPLMLSWLVFSGLVIYLLFAVLALLMPTAKVANIVVNASTFPLLMLGGSFFPMEAMPPWLASIGQFVPNGFLLKGLKDWLVREELMLNAMLYPFILGVIMLMVFWLLSRFLVKQLIHKV